MTTDNTQCIDQTVATSAIFYSRLQLDILNAVLRQKSKVVACVAKCPQYLQHVAKSSTRWIFCNIVPAILLQSLPWIHVQHSFVTLQHQKEVLYCQWEWKCPTCSRGFKDVWDCSFEIREGCTFETGYLCNVAASPPPDPIQCILSSLLDLLLQKLCASPFAYQELLPDLTFVRYCNHDWLDYGVLNMNVYISVRFIQLLIKVKK